MQKVTLFWFRRDLRLEDNTALAYALKEDSPVLPIFIFDKNILDKLEDKDDARVTFLQRTIAQMNDSLAEIGSGIKTYNTSPEEAFTEILNTYDVQAVFTNRDYEPYAHERDEKIESLLKAKGAGFYTFKDHVIFEKEEIVSGSGGFYKVFTPYSKTWLAKYKEAAPPQFGLHLESQNWFNHLKPNVHGLEEMGFEPTSIELPKNDINEQIITHYSEKRDIPFLDATSRLGLHLRFGTLSIRKLAKEAIKLNATFLNELIWRDFYAMILANNHHVAERAFKPAYDAIPWRRDEVGFQKWCEGVTGYPIVDAGMRQLNATGFMHNRVRMITASFLTKHLLIDWRWGEAYFAKKLLDFDLASNNGGWQWAAGTGTDAQPYFRVFNPQSQTEKFDKELKYIKKWVPEYGTDTYPTPMVEHKFARLRAIDTYKAALGK